MKAQKDIIEKMAKDLKELKKSQPNGELKRIEACVNKLDKTVTSLHDKIMDPESGLIVQTNKNTEFRETCSPERESILEKFQAVLRWKKSVEWGLGVLFVAFIGALIKIYIG
mgnify:FL=1|tara:strand:- start:229 stop:564 length:336 start_codon:yes stop_codon:yes gene_type:complete